MLDTVPFTMHCYSLDWHPSDHVSFVDNVKLRKFHADSKVGSLRVNDREQSRLGYFRYKRRTNAMCTTLLCLRGRPRPSRPCGPGTASRSPGGPSSTRISRWVIRDWRIKCRGLYVIMKIKSHELMFLNCHLEEEFWLRNIFIQKQLNIWFFFFKSNIPF